VNEEKNGDFFSIEFSNDGLLIPEEMREKIFEPFYRLKENRTKPGSGIGLALARSLAQLHKGELFVKATNDGLNTFVLRLPLFQQTGEST
jgi:signal transduction histidine kinase